MSTTTFKDKIHEVYSTTSNVFAEQEAKNYEERVNDLLDFIGEVKGEMQIVNKDYNDLLEILSLEIAQTKTIKELIVMRETAKPLLQLSRKLLKAYNSRNETRLGLRSVLAVFKENIDDLNEMLEDVEKRITKNKSIDNLLADISNLTS